MEQRRRNNERRAAREGLIECAAALTGHAVVEGGLLGAINLLEEGGGDPVARVLQGRHGKAEPRSGEIREPEWQKLRRYAAVVRRAHPQLRVELLDTARGTKLPSGARTAALFFAFSGALSHSASQRHCSDATPTDDRELSDGADDGGARSARDRHVTRSACPSYFSCLPEPGAAYLGIVAVEAADSEVKRDEKRNASEARTLEQHVAYLRSGNSDGHAAWRRSSACSPADAIGELRVAAPAEAALDWLVSGSVGLLGHQGLLAHERQLGTGRDRSSLAPIGEALGRSAGQGARGRRGPRTHPETALSEGAGEWVSGWERAEHRGAKWRRRASGASGTSRKSVVFVGQDSHCRQHVQPTTVNRVRVLV